MNPDAYDAYLLGRHHWNERNPQSLEKAIAYFRSAASAVRLGPELDEECGRPGHARGTDGE